MSEPFMAVLAVLFLVVPWATLIWGSLLIALLWDKVGEWRDRRDPGRVVRREQEAEDRRTMLRMAKERWGDHMGLWPYTWRRQIAKQFESETASRR